MSRRLPRVPVLVCDGVAIEARGEIGRQRYQWEQHDALVLKMDADETSSKRNELRAINAT